MKTTLLTLLVVFSIFVVKSQNLIVGYNDPNEILHLNTGSFSYDTVVLFNNATLNITNQTQFVVNDVIILLGTSNLNVENSYFEVNNLFSTQDTSTANLKDSLVLSCNIYVLGSSALYIESATVDIPMTFKGEFGWWSVNNSLFEITNSDFNLGSGALNGLCADSAAFTQFNNQYTSTMLPMTFGIAGSSNVSIDSCYGGMEFLIAQNASLNIQNSDFFMIWYTFTDGDTAYYSYPPSNSVLFPASSNVSGVYSFSNLLPNVVGVDFNVNIQNTDGVFWGILSKKNSDVIVTNSSILACGFYFNGTAVDTAIGFIDSQFYPSYNSPFSDRGFALNNSSVNAWNFYPDDTSEISIENCIYGESIGAGESITRVNNSICDGKGGYFGGNDNSKTFVYNSEITRANGNAQILNFRDNSSAFFNQSKVTGGIVISENSQLYFGNTEYNSTPVVNQNSYFAEAWLDSISNGTISSLINISGTIRGINGITNSSKITRYTISYSLPDSTGIIQIKDTTTTNFNIINGGLANWNTQGLATGNYLLWLTIFIDGDSTISCNREVTLDNNTNITENDSVDDFYLYPNPTNGILTIRGIDNINSIEIFDTRGKVIYMGNSSLINLKGHSKGMYFIRVKTKKGELIKKIVLF